MILNIIVCCQYSGDKICKGSANDLRAVKDLLIGEKQIFDDMDSNNLNDLIPYLQCLSSKGYQKIIFYFSGHGSDGHLEIGDHYISLNQIKNLLLPTLTDQGDLFLICDCCCQGNLNLPFELINDKLIYLKDSSSYPEGNFILLMTPGPYQTLGSSEGSLFTNKLIENYRPEYPLTDIISKISKQQNDIGLYQSHNVLTTIPLTVNYRIFTDDTIRIKHYGSLITTR